MQWGLQGTSRVASRNSSLLSSCEQVHWCALESLQGNRASSHIEGGMSCFSSCGQKLWVCLELQQEPLGTSHVSSGKSGLLSSLKGHLRFLLSHCRGISPHLQLRRESQFSTPVAIGILGFLSSFIRVIRPHLILKHGTHFSSRVIKVVSGLLSS